MHAISQKNSQHCFRPLYITVLARARKMLVFTKLERCKSASLQLLEGAVQVCRNSLRPPAAVLFGTVLQALSKQPLKVKGAVCTAAHNLAISG